MSADARAAPTAAVVAFYELEKKAIAAATQQRWARSCEYYERALAAARALWNDDLTVVHWLVLSFTQLALVEMGQHVSLETALHFEARRTLLRRIEAGTLLKRCSEDEENHFTQVAVLTHELMNNSKASSSSIACLAAVRQHAVGYVVALDAARKTLELLYPHSVPAFVPPVVGTERAAAQEFILRVLDLAPEFKTTREISPEIPEEREFIEKVQRLLAGEGLEPPFRAALNRSFNLTAVQASLRGRGSLRGHSESELIEIRGLFIAKKQADVAKHGLRWCALPACAKQEVGVFDFKACSACKAVVYCSAEHGALHWAKGHKKECAALKVAGAKPRSTVDKGKPEPVAHP